MRRLLAYAMIVAALAFTVQWAFIRYVPDLVYRIAIYRSGKPANQWIHAGRTDAAMRRVVMPNPDFVYSALFYDLTDRDMIISGVLPDSGYASVAFYDDRCQPYFVYNNLSQPHKGKFSLKLSKSISSDTDVIPAKTGRGVLICRYLIQGTDGYQKMKAYQSQLAVALK